MQQIKDKIKQKQARNQPKDAYFSKKFPWNNSKNTQKYPRNTIVINSKYHNYPRNIIETTKKYPWNILKMDIMVKNGHHGHPRNILEISKKYPKIILEIS